MHNNMMRKFFLLAYIVFLSVALKAQRSIEGMINAEKSFATYSVAHGTKEAFLKFADSSAIVFDKGKPVNAIELWNSREKRPGVLNWFPNYAEISLSNDFGYTTGPWTFTLNDSVVARGNFSTVWHINNKGEWKFLIDLGVSNTPQETDTFLVKKQKELKQIKNKESLLEAENEFIKEAQHSVKNTYEKYKAPDARLERNSQTPAWFQDAYYHIYNMTPQQIDYTINGSGVSAINDLGYVYGSTNINGKADNYLRVWRIEDNKWKIALEVLRY